MYITAGLVGCFCCHSMFESRDRKVATALACRHRDDAFESASRREYTLTCDLYDLACTTYRNNVMGVEAVAGRGGREAWV